MNVRNTIRVVSLAFLLLCTINLCGCGGGGSGGGGGAKTSGGGGGGGDAKAAGTRADGAKLTGTDQEASAFVLARIQEHWIKGSDGWTTQFQMRNPFGQVVAGTPNVLFRQIRDFKITIAPGELTDAQRLNGADYRARVEFEDAPERYYRTVEDYEGPKGWSLWRDHALLGVANAVERRNGKWLISDDSLWEGIKPDAAAVSAAK